ncbi:putative L-ascorbate peroxidase 6 [Tetrabaena socialis]|uniref:L-ascorbate peroxidase n=1 Tax=Tetrabaena socialis TaxID=47790 RepID=A0A2J7ZIL1_9CHLO|nr:putative L-ascorbate peroxidase 6 [Tetrabaena socialis]|eukprot:PNH00090.1 putative L-ascorbate peroxidase 6 [Tetrabaena socialis]
MLVMRRSYAAKKRPGGNRRALSPLLAASTDAGGLTRRELLKLTAPLLLLGALPAGLLAAPQAARAAGPVLPSKEVQAALDKALARSVTKGKAAVALRLVFHDAGTFSAAAKDGGLNASIQYELDRPENMGLKRGWRIVEQVRQDLRGTAAEGVVSDADLVALAGAYGIRICGGPAIAVPIGRPTATAGSVDPPGRMPAETFSAAELKASFAAKGFNVKELVVLSGAHTLGSKGYGDPNRFDTEYFRSLLRKPWLAKDDAMAAMIGLPSDHVLPDDPECLPYIQRYAEDQEAFFADFAAAYVKLTGLGVAGWA